MNKILRKSYSFFGYLGFVMNSFQSVFSEFLFGYLYLLIFENYQKGEIATYIIVILTLLVGIYFIFAIPLWGYLMESSQNVYKGNLKKRYMECLLKNKYQDKLSQAEKINLVQKDINNAQRLAGWDLVVLFQAIISGLVSSFVIGGISIKLLIFIVGMGIIPVLTNIVIAKYFKKTYSFLRESYQEKLKKILNYINNIIIVKIYGIEDEIKDDILKESKKIKKEKEKISLIKNTSIFFDSIIYDSFYKVILIYYGIKLILSKEINFGSLVLAFSMLEGISFFLSYIGNYIKNIQNIMVSLDKLKGRFLIKEEKKVLSNNEIDRICIKDMSFSYGMNKIFDKFSLSLKFPSNYIIHGQNGKGKSTLLKLISGFIRPDDGRIEFLKDGKKVDKNMAYVGQDVFIFNDSLLNNLILENENIEVEEVKKAIKTVGLYLWYKSLKDGLDTIIDEKGKNISKGQQMRISIARALLKNKRIILLDEPDANLDSLTMKNMIEAIEKNYQINIIMVSHIEDTSKILEKFVSINL